jgi:positive regulator of sigma E activity
VASAPRLLRETGRVVEARGGRAIIELEVAADGRAGPGGRPECAGCGLCAPAAAGGGRFEIRARLEAGRSVGPGDRVEVEIRLASSGRAGLLLCGLPLAAFLGFGLTAWLVTGSENAGAVSGFSALGAAFLALFLVERRWGSAARVVRRLE